LANVSTPNPEYVRVLWRMLDHSAPISFLYEANRAPDPLASLRIFLLMCGRVASFWELRRS
jgi:hypothetical protein